MSEQNNERRPNVAMIKYRTRYWSNDEGNNGVQFRNDGDPKVWMCTNIGWVPVGNAPTDEISAEQFAEDLAKGFGYDEVSESQAEYLAGWSE